MTSSTSSSSSDCLFCYCFTMSLAVIGAFAILRFLYSIFRIVYAHFIRGGVDLKKYGAGSGAWAVITGGTDGIGKAFAVALAKKGFNIVLVSRTPAKLDEVSKEIKTESQVQVKTVAIDLSKATNDDYDRLSTAIVGLDVSVLVNNAGLSNEIPEKYLETDPQRVRDIVAVNITAVNEVTRVVLPLLVQRRKGLVFNIGSASSIVPTPLLSVYSASKAYLSYWSQALAAEYASSGVHVECQIPFFVVTKMSKRSRSSLAIPTPNTYVRNALGKTGFETNYSPYFIHDLMGWAMRLLPESFLIQKNKQMHEDIQKRAIAKKQREATQSSKKD